MQDNVSKSSFQDLLSSLKKIATENLQKVPEFAPIEPDPSPRLAATHAAHTKPPKARPISAGFRAPKGVTLYPIAGRTDNRGKVKNELPRSEEQAAAMMSEFGVSRAEFAELLADFRAIDGDDSGVVQIAEVGRLLSKERNGIKPNAADVRARMSQFDHNADGEITFREYIRTLVTPAAGSLGMSDIELGSRIAHCDDEILMISARSNTEDAADGLQPDEVIPSPVPEQANKPLLQANPDEPFKDTFRTLFLGTPPTVEPLAVVVPHTGKTKPARTKQRASTAGRRRRASKEKITSNTSAPIDFSQFGGIFAAEPVKVEKKPRARTAGTRREPLDFSKFGGAFASDAPKVDVAPKLVKPSSAGARSPLDFAQFGGQFAAMEETTAVKEPRRRRRPLTAPTFGKRTSFKDLSTQMWQELQIQLDEANDLSKVLGLSKRFARGGSSTRIVMTTAGTTEHLSAERFDKELAKLKKASQALHKQQRQQARVPNAHRGLPAAQQAEIANQRLETLLDDTRKLSSELSDQLSVLTGNVHNSYSCFE